MSLTLHTLAPARGARTASFRIGRGDGSGRGKTAGKGTKGQRSRSGGRAGLKLKGLKQMILGFPKMRGFRSLRAEPATVTLTSIAKAFKANERVDFQALRAKRLVPPVATRAKLVGTGLTHPIIVKGLAISAGAKAVIEKAGGSIQSK